MERAHTAYSNLESLKIQYEGNELRVVYSVTRALFGITSFLLLYAAFLYFMVPLIYESDSYTSEPKVALLANSILWGTPVLALAIFITSLIKQLRLNKPYLVLNFSDKTISIPRQGFTAKFDIEKSTFLHKLFSTGNSHVSEFNYLHEGETEIAILHSSGHALFYSKLRKRLNSLQVNCDKQSIKE